MLVQQHSHDHWRYVDSSTYREQRYYLHPSQAYQMRDRSESSRDLLQMRPENLLIGTLDRLLQQRSS